MDSTTIRRGVDAFGCLVALGALWLLTRLLPGVDALAWMGLAIAVAILALTDGERSPLTLGLPALMLILLLVSEEPARMLTGGIVLATCLVIAGARWSTRGAIASWRGVVLLVAGFIPIFAWPAGTAGPFGALVTCAGAIAILVAATRDGRVGLDLLMLAWCAALAAPTVPIRASLFPFVVASMVLLLRRPKPASAVAFIVIVLVAGKWYVPVMVAAGLGFAVERYWRRGRTKGPANAAVAAPILSGIPVAGLSALLIMPDAWGRGRRVGLAAAGAALVLAVAALVVQPSLATLYAIAALVCVAALAGDERWSPALLTFSILMSGLTAWSGAIAGAFPLPLSFVVIALIALIGAASGLGLEARGAMDSVGSALAAGAAVALVFLHPSPIQPDNVIATDLRIASGTSITVALPEHSGQVLLRVSGGNIVGMKGGEVIGVVRAEPGGGATEIRVGDVADWGARRAEHYLSSDNPRPLEPAGPIFDKGRSAFLSGAGIVRVEAATAKSLTIEALPSLGEQGRLLIGSVEVAR